MKILEELYHNFVQNTSCRIRHLVKLIDTTHAAITQNKSTAGNKVRLTINQNMMADKPFKDQLFGVGITGNIGRQTNSR